jgi:phosphomannomutase
METLRARLTYEPRELQFGTSGRRGLVTDLTPLEIYINVLAELQYLQPERGQEIYFARDLRPSSPAIAHAVFRAGCDGGLRPVNLGCIPTPALASYGWRRGRASILITGSHIPFDRNGYKLNTSRRELLKSDEAAIGALVARVRERVYGQTPAQSPFQADGNFKEIKPLPPEDPSAAAEYLQRYATFFAPSSLRNQRVAVYQHSAVGRDLLVRILEHFGAEAVPMGRSESFVPIDTENIGADQLALIQKLADGAGRLDGVVSVDGDSDRPLVLGLERSGQVRFFGGDLLGMVVAEYLGADSVVVPISCNDAIDRGNLARVIEPKTRIGSPYVIEAMERARGKGRQVVCGWEANGGFLTGSDIHRNGAILAALPTRDAFLPILCVLFAAQEQAVPLVDLFARLPKRYSRAALIRQFPRAAGLKLVADFSQGDAQRLEEFFTAEAGFGKVTHVDCTDGVRIFFSNGDVAHFRPSGNADELRIYAVADTQERADAIAAMGVGEPDGILRRMIRS